MKTDRLFAITNYILAKKTVTAEELAREFEVSVRTIYRDIDILSANGIPVYTIQGKGGGISLMEEYAIDRTMLSDKEQREVLMALQSVQAVSPLQLRDSLNKLQGLFCKPETDWIEIDFSGWARKDDDQALFFKLRDSILNCRVVSFQYYNNRGEGMARKVEPMKLFFKGQTWYLYAFCRKRKDFRYFKLSRIEDLSICEEKFERKPVTELLREFRLEEKGKLIKVKLLVDKCMAYRIFDEFPREQIHETDKGFLIESSLYDNEWLYGYLSGFGNSIEILEPKELREQFKRHTEQILNKYK